MNILITGATSGIGYDTGIRLAREGHYIYLTTHYDKQMSSLKEKNKRFRVRKKDRMFLP